MPIPNSRESSFPPTRPEAEHVNISLSILTLWVTTVLLFPPSALALDNKEKMDKLTAAFIYQISKFIKWPDAVFSSKNAALTICVLGNGQSTLMKRLTAFETKKSHGRKIKIHGFHNKAQFLRHQNTTESCQILFTPNGEWSKFSHQEIRSLGQTTLLVGKTRNFLQKGGMLALILVKSKMKIFLNPDSVAGSRLKLESRLRVLAKTI